MTKKNNKIFETATEKDLADNEPRIVSGVYGAKSKEFKKKFRSQREQDRFFDHPDRQGNYEVQYVQKLDEGFLDALLGDTGKAGLQSMFKKGMTGQEQLAQNNFIKTFVAKASSALEMAIKSGLVNPSIAPKSQPTNTPESANYKKLNALFESILEQMAGQTIGTYLANYFARYMGSVPYDKNHAQQIINDVETNYSKNRGIKGLTQLAQLAFASQVAGSGTTPGQAGTGQAGAHQAKAAKPAGKVTSTVRPATKPANPLAAPTLNRNAGTVTAGAPRPAPKGVTSGGTLFKESKRRK